MGIGRRREREREVMMPPILMKEWGISCVDVGGLRSLRKRRCSGRCSVVCRVIQERKIAKRDQFRLSMTKTNHSIKMANEI